MKPLENLPEGYRNVFSLDLATDILVRDYGASMDVFSK